MSDDEKVGYGKPPRKHRFQPGKSGNPKGRPKKTPPSYEDLLNVLSEDVIVRQGNKNRKMQPFEAAVRKMVAKAVTDRSVSHALKFMELLDKYDVLRPLPAQRKTSGVLHVPRDWDWNEWLEMLGRYGAPPWPGKRSGLTLLEEKRLEGDVEWFKKQGMENRRGNTGSGQASQETGKDAREVPRGEKASSER